MSNPFYVDVVLQKRWSRGEGNMTDVFGPLAFRYRNILAVDDEPDVVQGLKDLLETSFPGVRVNIATSGQAGLEVLAKQGADLIITDYKMPKMNGLQFLETASRIRPGIPHIILTEYDRDLLQRKRGSADYAVMQKPVDPVSMVQAVGDAMTKVLLVDDEPDILPQRPN